MRDTIVGEVTRNWLTEHTAHGAPLLSEQFEAMIEVNRTRGYTLQSWRMTSTLTPAVLSETIVAVFARDARDQTTPAVWRDIQTAPKDGTRILVAVDGPSVGLSRVPYLYGVGYWFVGGDGSAGWLCTTLPMQEVSGDLGEPTAWMPIPPPPSPRQTIIHATPGATR